MLPHIGVHMTLVATVLIAYSLAHPVPVWLIGVLLFFLVAAHIVFDQRTFVEWWTRLVGAPPEHPWLGIVVDQVFHLLALVMVVAVFVQASH